MRPAFAGPTTLATDMVDVAIVIDQCENVMVIPRVAVQRDDDASFVLVVNPTDNVLHRKVVQIGFATRDQIQILTGIAAGDRVITSGFDQVGDGSVIVIERYNDVRLGTTCPLSRWSARPTVESPSRLRTHHAS